LPMTNSTNAKIGEADSEGGESFHRAPTSWLMGALREPLLHFLLLGAALFAVYSYWSSDDIPGDQALVVSRGKIEHLAALFTRTWQRPPTREELEGLIDDYIHEEAAYREGTAIGLDRNDTIIRRRIRQKLDFVAGDLATQVEPTDEELQAYLDEHSDEFLLESQFTFRQVYFDPDRHDAGLSEVVNDLVAALRDDPTIDAAKQGDRTLLEFRYADVSGRGVASLFGEEFAAALERIDPGMWRGPIESGYGVHAVIVDDFQPGRLPELKDVRIAVLREWEHDRRQQVTDMYYQGLVEKYDVVIEWPEPDGEIE